MTASVEESEKLARIDNIHLNTSHLVKKIMKIGPVDQFKKKERNGR